VDPVPDPLLFFLVLPGIEPGEHIDIRNVSHNEQR
jgi:hypothetical protein